VVCPWRSVMLAGLSPFYPRFVPCSRTHCSRFTTLTFMGTTEVCCIQRCLYIFAFVCVCVYNSD
jgi:hypothetical protein